ncbi:MAG: hypothetical protein J2P49_04590, partial [Methylocapsa sp.]|nr:hypothetical protein [Methylocapsa sp.]
AQPKEPVSRTGDLSRWRADGTLEFLGRADRQIKMRGFRIEPMEIEAALQSCDGVAQAVVIPREIAGEMRLVAYLVPCPGKNLPASAGLRTALAARLPDYMIPSLFVTLGALPLTVTGKIDRQALPAPDKTIEPATFQPPRNKIEATLSRIFSALTGTTHVGLDDNFFEIGGSSLGAITLVTRINKTFDGHLTVRAIFEQPTIRQLAAPLSQEKRNLRLTENPLLITVIARYRWFFCFLAFMVTIQDLCNSGSRSQDTLILS